MARAPLLTSVSAVLALVAAGARPAGAATGLASIDDPGATAPGVERFAAATSSRAGAHLYVIGDFDDDSVPNVADQDSAVLVFSRDATSGRLTFVEAERDGVGGVTDMEGAQSIAVSPDGADVYVGAAFSLVHFAREATSGALAFVGSTLSFNTSGLAFGPGGTQLYAADFTNSRVVTYGRDPGTGALTQIQALQNGTGGITGLQQPSAIVVAPDGRGVYLTSPVADAVVVFSRDVATGLLTYVGTHVNEVGNLGGFERAATLAVSPDGTSLYVSGDRDRGVVVFARDPVTSALTYVELEEPLGRILVRNVQSLAVLPDGTGVVAAVGSSSVALFARDAASGRLTLVGGETFAAGRSIHVAPPGTHVYAGGFGPRLGVFRLTTLDCSPAPLPACKAPTQAQKAQLVFKNSPIDGKDKVIWTWTKGAATTVAELGDPVGTTNDFVFCVWDQAGGAQPRFRALIPAGGRCGAKPCWKATGAGVKYTDPQVLPEGVKSATVTAGAAGAAKSKLKGDGRPLLLPLLPLAPPVTAQLQAANGTCLGAVYGTPTANDAAQFRAKSD